MDNIENGRDLKMKGLVIIATPLELLHFLNMIETTKYGQIKWDLLFLECSASNYTLFSKITETRLFNRAFFVFDAYKRYVKRSKQFIKRYLSYLNKKTVFDLYPELPKDFYEYDYMCFFTHESYVICNYAYHFNKKLKFIWLEDGMTTYVNYGDFFPKSTMKSFTKSILLHHYGKSKVESQLLYHPELATYDIPCHRYKLKSLKGASKTANISDELFGVIETDFIRSKFIYFDNSFAASGMDINDDDILQIVSNVVGKNNLTIKVHPRNDANLYRQNGYNVSTNSGIPWEAYYFHADEVADKVLIGVISTALLSPFLYFGSRQKVISLIEFLDMKKIDISTRKYIESVRDVFMLPNPDIFILPKTVDELLSVLGKI